MFTLVTRESVSKVGSRRQTGFCVCSGLFLQNSPLSLRFQIGVLRRRGASGPEPRSTPFCSHLSPPFVSSLSSFSSSLAFCRPEAYKSDDDQVSGQFSCHSFWDTHILEIRFVLLTNKDIFGRFRSSFFFFRAGLLRLSSFRLGLAHPKQSSPVAPNGAQLLQILFSLPIAGSRN